MSYSNPLDVPQWCKDAMQRFVEDNFTVTCVNRTSTIIPPRASKAPQGEEAEAEAKTEAVDVPIQF